MQRFLAASFVLFLCLVNRSGAMNAPEKGALRASIAHARQNIDLDPLESFLGQLDARITALEGKMAENLCQTGEYNFTFSGKSKIQVEISFPSAFPSAPSLQAAISGIERTTDGPPFKGYLIHTYVGLRTDGFLLFAWVHDQSITSLTASWIACVDEDQSASVRAAFEAERKEEQQRMERYLLEEEEEEEEEQQRVERYLLDAQ